MAVSTTNQWGYKSHNRFTCIQKNNHKVELVKGMFHGSIDINARVDWQKNLELFWMALWGSLWPRHSLLRFWGEAPQCNAHHLFVVTKIRMCKWQTSPARANGLTTRHCWVILIHKFGWAKATTEHCISKRFWTCSTVETFDISISPFLINRHLVNLKSHPKYKKHMSVSLHEFSLSRHRLETNRHHLLDWGYIVFLYQHCFSSKKDSHVRQPAASFMKSQSE